MMTQMVEFIDEKIETNFKKSMEKGKKNSTLNKK